MWDSTPDHHDGWEPWVRSVQKKNMINYIKLQEVKVEKWEAEKWKIINVKWRRFFKFFIFFKKLK